MNFLLYIEEAKLALSHHEEPKTNPSTLMLQD